MANVVRLVNGGTIQVRTGVVQGIGAQGPRGVAGPQGIDGPSGPQGDPGPMGQILQMQARTSVAAANPLAAATDTTIAFGSVGYDDMSVFTSTTNATLPAAGDYMICCYLQFAAAAAGLRELWFATGGADIAHTSRASIVAQPCYVDLSFPYRSPGGDVIRVHARSDVALSISQGVWTVTRLGSGPPGVAGPQGAQGVQGVAGPAGPAGPSGSANSGFTTYALLLPH